MLASWEFQQYFFFIKLAKPNKCNIFVLQFLKWSSNPKKSIIMNKAQLIDAIAAEAGLTKADSKKALDAFIKATQVALKKGDRVALVGFGSFSVAKRSARTGRNPQTGKEIKIAAKKVVKFKAGSDLTDAVQK
jgi:DNA-binding protein HU-beta